MEPGLPLIKGVYRGASLKLGGPGGCAEGDPAESPLLVECVLSCSSDSRPKSHTELAGYLSVVLRGILMYEVSR
jgi:hypothetical protein